MKPGRWWSRIRVAGTAALVAALVASCGPDGRPSGAGPQGERRGEPHGEPQGKLPGELLGDPISDRSVQDIGAAQGRARQKEGAAADPLAPFEASDEPAFFGRLALPRDRDYVLLAYLPSAVPFDIASPERLRASLNRVRDHPEQVIEAKTLLGHLMVGWQCGDRRGITSISGESDGQALAMMEAGWGVLPILSTFRDGHLISEAGFLNRHDNALRQGRGIVMAAQVSPRDCEGLRTRLADFVTDPRVPARRFGLLADPARRDGAGCLSLGWYLAEAAGIMPGMSRAFRRDYPLHRAAIGQGDAIPPEVELFCPVDCRLAEEPIPLEVLLARRWDVGPVAAEVSVPDSELFLAALVAMRDGVAPPGDWRAGRVIEPERSDIRRARDFGRDWAARYPTRRIADPGGVSALVLERGGRGREVLR